ncbi:MAG: hypothetical protein LBQ77_00070 [Treponema sp.]|jgi:adenylate kinase family enzyme|nr:hypothetical protein [Treponema sp.]
MFFFRPIKVYALVGASGTGKSFQAKFLAQKYHIDFIIDDGLLIYNNRIVAGHSAKTEKTFLAAVKVALFDEKSQRDEIARNLQGKKSKRILILGTSEKMVNKIAVRLQLPQPGKIIKIEDISTQTDIEKAIRMRRIEGKHVIPVPSAEIKKSYPQIFYDAVRIFKWKKVPVNLAPTMYEKSLVRPVYSQRSTITISEEALSLMVFQCVDDYNQSITSKKIIIKEGTLGYRIVITVDIPFGTQLDESVQKLQQYIIDHIEHYTSIPIEEVNLIIDKLIPSASITLDA